MTARLRQVGVRRIGAGRWRVDLAADAAWTGGAIPPVAELSLRPADPGEAPPRIESVAGSDGRWSLVVAADRDHGVRSYELLVDGGPAWRTGIRLADVGFAEPAPGAGVSAVVEPRPDIDYTARDFSALQAMLVQAVDQPIGGTLQSNPVAQAVAVIDEMAYLGDALSYQQDAIATESHLSTCRRRVSALRHAALLAYQAGERVSSRAWVRIEVAETLTLPAGTRLLAAAHGAGPTLPTRDVHAALAGGAIQFETLEPVTLTTLAIPERHSADRGGTSIVVEHLGKTLPAAKPLVLVEPDDPSDGPGQVVRVVAVDELEDGRQRLHWPAVDSLPQRLRRVLVRVSIGNLVLVEQRVSWPATRLATPGGGRYRPRLPRGRTAFVYGRGRGDDDRAAAEVLLPLDRPPLPAVHLEERATSLRHWVPRLSLLQSGSGSAVFVVEEETDGVAYLRFGDGVNGTRPRPGSVVTARQATGAGAAGNVGPHAIRHLVRDGDRGRIRRVYNPIAAIGGADPEPLASIQLRAPDAYRVNDRTVTAADYVEQAKRAGATDVQAVIVPGGSGPVAVVYVWWGSWADVEAGKLERVRRALRARQPVGVDLTVRTAIPIAVQVELVITVEPGFSTERAARELDAVFAHDLLAPDRFGFGTPLYPSDLVDVGLSADGVVDVTVPVLDWQGAPGRPHARDELTPPTGRIIRIADDLLAPERGRLRYRIRTASA
jgi:hypothetical protein